MRENNSKSVYVLGLDYEVKDTVSWEEAVVHILKGTMTPFKVHETKRVRSAGGKIDMAWPLMVRLNYWVTVPKKRPVDLDSHASRYDILKRDGHTCGYCGAGPSSEGERGGLTIDHIVPQSRGGKNTWGNLVAACKSCNAAKADRTPEEAGMKLLWSPHVATDRYAKVQKEVWKILETGEGYTTESTVRYEGILK